MRRALLDNFVLFQMFVREPRHRMKNRRLACQRKKSGGPRRNTPRRFLTFARSALWRLWHQIKRANVTTSPGVLAYRVAQLRNASGVDHVGYRGPLGRHALVEIVPEQSRANRGSRCARIERRAAEFDLINHTVRRVRPSVDR